MHSPSAFNGLIGRPYNDVFHSFNKEIEAHLLDFDPKRVLKENEHTETGLALYSEAVQRIAARLFFIPVTVNGNKMLFHEYLEQRNPADTNVGLVPANFEEGIAILARGRPIKDLAFLYDYLEPSSDAFKFAELAQKIAANREQCSNKELQSNLDKLLNLPFPALMDFAQIKALELKEVACPAAKDKPKAGSADELLHDAYLKLMKDKYLPTEKGALLADLQKYCRERCEAGIFTSSFGGGEHKFDKVAMAAALIKAMQGNKTDLEELIKDPAMKRVLENGRLGALYKKIAKADAALGMEALQPKITARSFDSKAMLNGPADATKGQAAQEAAPPALGSGSS